MRWWAVVPALLLAGGCGDEVEEQFAERTALPDCGTHDAGLDTSWPQAEDDAVACFDRALRDGADAELRVDRLTDEGDPIPTWYRLTGDRLEIYTDNTDDSFGSAGWTFEECAAPARLPDQAGRLC